MSNSSTSSEIVDFGKYELLGRIGKGGMADVFLGRPKGQQRLVAIKCMKKNLASQKHFVDMFIREGKLAVMLNHDALVKTYEIGKIRGTYFICMEYISGVDLSLIIRRCRGGRERRIPVPIALHIAIRMCEGLHYAHELKDGDGVALNLVNRDVSPSNIRISFDGDVKVFDFGIAKSTTGLTGEIGVLKGKISHMSPEQVRGLPIDRRTDIFSTGIVLHEMLTGEKLFRGDSEFQTMDMVRKAEVMPPSAGNPRVPKELDEIVIRALQKSPNDRFQTAEEMAVQLRAVLEQFRYAKSDLRDLAREMCKEEWNKEQHNLELFLSAKEPKKALVSESRPDEDYGELEYEIAEVPEVTSAAKQQQQPAAPSKTPPILYAMLAFSIALILLAVFLLFRMKK